MKKIGRRQNACKITQHAKANSSRYNVCLFELSQQFFSHVRTFYWVEPVLSNELKETASWLTVGFEPVTSWLGATHTTN